MPKDKKALRRKKAINIAASLAASGVPFNNESMSPDTMAAYLSKKKSYGETKPLTHSKARKKKP